VRQITVTAPQGKGPEIAEIAFSVGIRDVSVSSIRALKSNEPDRQKDHLEIETATHLAKAFVEKLSASSFFNTEDYAITVRQPRIDLLYAQYSQPHTSARRTYQRSVSGAVAVLAITFGFVGRIYLGAILLAFGLVDYRLLFMIAGLLFIPLLPLMLGIGFSLWTRQWKLLGQSSLALLTAIVLMAAGGATVAIFSHPPIRYVEANSLLTGLLISLVVGVAAGLATSDDVGRREMIGLAATAQVAIVPTWFRISGSTWFAEAIQYPQNNAPLVCLSTSAASSSLRSRHMPRSECAALHCAHSIKSRRRDDLNSSPPSRAVQGEAIAALRQSR
jgi:hypothetical protein